MSEQLVFESTMEALLRAAGPRLTPSCIARLKAAGFDVGDKLRPAYPATVWAESVRIVGEELFPAWRPRRRTACWAPAPSTSLPRA